MARTKGLPTSSIICGLAILLHFGLSLLSEYYRVLAGMYPAVVLSRLFGLGHPRGDVLPGAVSSGFALTPIILGLEGLAIAAVGLYFLKREGRE